MVVKKATKRFVFACVNTWVSTRRHYMKNTWLKHCAWTLVHVKQYVQIIRALILNTPPTLFNETTRIFHLLHPLVEVDLPPFVDDFHPEIKVILNWKHLSFFKICSPHVSFGGPLGMMYELPWYYFVTNDFTSGFDLFIKLWAHCLKSCSTFNVTFTFYILTLNVEETI
jgi:hypothetical protein